jgi:FkbM family methyltransferase
MTKTFIFDFLDDTRTFIDVGANIGTHSIVAARNARRVISIEGDVHNNSLLKENTQLIKNVESFNYYLSDKNESQQVKYWASFNHELIEDYREVVTLDKLVEELSISPDLIKIDTDGSEIKILSGALKTLSNFAPTLIIEVDRESKSSGQSFFLIRRMLKQEGYFFIGFLDYENAVFIKKWIRGWVGSIMLLFRSKNAVKKMLKISDKSSSKRRNEKKFIVTNGRKFNDAYEFSSFRFNPLNIKITNLLNPVNLLFINSSGLSILSLTVPVCFNLTLDLSLSKICLSNDISKLIIRNGPLGKSLVFVSF